MNLKQLITQLKSSEYLANIGKLMSGTGLAHLIGIAAIPLLTRLYTPEEFGIYATYLSVYTISFSVITLRYESAILVPAKEREANNIAVLAATLALAGSLGLFIILLFAGDLIANWLNIQAIGAFLLLIPVSVVSYSLFQVFNFSLNRAKKYASMAAGRMVLASGSAGVQIGFGASQISATYPGLIIGKVFGDAVGLITLIWQRLKINQSVLAGVSPKRMIAMAKRYKNFPLYNMPHALTTNVSNNLPVLLFNSYFSEAIAGFYSIAIKACYAPVQVIAQASFQVFSQRIAEKFGRKEQLMPFIKSTLLLQAGVGFFPFLALFIVSPWLFSFVLGSEWSDSGEYVRILAPYFFVVFTVTPLNFIPLLLNRQRKAFAIDVVHLLMKLLSLITGIYFDSVYIALALYSFSGIIVLIYLLSWVWIIASNAEKRINNR